MLIVVVPSHSFPVQIPRRFFSDVLSAVQYVSFRDASLGKILFITTYKLSSLYAVGTFPLAVPVAVEARDGRQT